MSSIEYICIQDLISASLTYGVLIKAVFSVNYGKKNYKQKRNNEQRKIHCHSTNLRISMKVRLKVIAYHFVDVIG